MLRPAEREFWEAWRTGLPARRRPRRPFVQAAFAGTRRTTDALIALYRAGRKTAGSSLVRDFRANGERLPRAGDFWIVLDSRSRPALLLRTARVEVNPFGRIPARVVRAEGEGDLSLAYWKRVHAALYRPHLAAWGISDLAGAEVVTEHFLLLVDALKMKGGRPRGRPPVPTVLRS